MGLFGARFLFGERSVPNKRDVDILLYLSSFGNECGLICIVCKCNVDTDYPIAIHKYIHYQLYSWIMHYCVDTGIANNNEDTYLDNP